jgi:hypothetical protein
MLASGILVLARLGPIGPPCDPRAYNDAHRCHCYLAVDQFQPESDFPSISRDCHDSTLPVASVLKQADFRGWSGGV